VKIGVEYSVKAAVVHINGLVNSETVNEFVVGSLLAITDDILKEISAASGNLSDFVLNRTLEIGEATLQTECNEVLLAILSGDTIILMEGYDVEIVH